MTTQRLQRDWRIPTAGLAVLVLLMAGFALHTHWNAFIQWCLATQITLHRYLVMYLLQLNNHQYSGGLWLLTGAFLYGVLHAVGPGHGKFIVTTYLTTNKESQLAARVVPFIGSLMQGVSAIAFVFILAVGLNLASGDISTSRWYVEKISALLIAAFGAFIIYQALSSLRPRKMAISAIKPLHQHNEHCGCGHHGVGVDLAKSDWKTRQRRVFLSLVNSRMLVNQARTFFLKRLDLCVNIFNLLLYIIVVLTQDLFRFLNIRRRRRCPFQGTIRRLLHGNTGNQADHRNDHQIVSRHHQVLRALHQ